MARLARLVVPGIAHHVTQRGADGAQVFGSVEDYALYRDWLGEACRGNGVEVLAWTLLPNRVQLILVPSDPDGMRRALAPLHRRYAGHVHAREQCRGHLWHGRFSCVAMDDAHLPGALRHVALAPVRAGLAVRADDWPWSSVHALLAGIDDGVTARDRILDLVPHFAALLEQGDDADTAERLRRAESIGRPVGDRPFFERIAALSGRDLTPRKRGPKPRLRAAPA